MGALLTFITSCIGVRKKYYSERINTDIYCYRSKKNYTLFRGCLIGDCNTGKTSFIKYIKGNKFSLAYHPTIGIDCGVKYLKDYKIYVYEICGNEKFESCLQCYFDNSNICLIFCDFNNSLSIGNVKKWYELYMNNSNSSTVIIVCNKTDFTNYYRINEIKKELN